MVRLSLFSTWYCKSFKYLSKGMARPCFALNIVSQQEPLVFENQKNIGSRKKSFGVSSGDRS